MTSLPDAPLRCPRRTVLSEWVDYNGHMNMAYYNVVFDNALDYVFAELGMDAAYVRERNASSFTAEVHVTYLREVVENDPLDVTFRLLDWDEKRMHIFQEMYHAGEGYLAATSEQMAIHVSMLTRRAAPFPADIQSRLAAMMEAHKALPRPPQAGHVIGIRRKPAG